MTDVETLRGILRNNWNGEHHIIMKFPSSGETKFAAMHHIVKQHLHYLETVAGLEIFLSDDKFRDIVGYNIIDSAKFTWFVLRWS